MRCSETTAGLDSLLKNFSSPTFFLSETRAKYLSSMAAQALEAAATSTLVDVAMAKAWLTRLSGTPLSLNGPETSRRPEARDFRTTTRLPRKRPESRIATVPAEREGRTFGALLEAVPAVRALRDFLGAETSSPG